MSHDHDSKSKLELASHAALPMVLMLFVEMALNFYAAPSNAIFISPYLLSIFVLGLIVITVVWKGGICNGQRGRLHYLLPFVAIFTIGNLVYSFAFTPKHTPLVVSGLASILLTTIFWQLPTKKRELQPVVTTSFVVIALGILLYLIVYWFEIPSLFNWLRANNFAQVLLGILLGGWYLMLSKSRLEAFLKYLVKLALIVSVLNYIWTVFALYKTAAVSPEGSLNYLPIIAYFAMQFGILAMLAWLLLGKNIKNPTAWTIATLLGILYPFINVI